MEIVVTFMFTKQEVSVLMSVTQKTLPTQDDGTIKIQDIENAIRADDPHFPKTRLVALENTQLLWRKSSQD